MVHSPVFEKCFAKVEENSEAQNALIKRLLGAEKVDLQKSTGKGLPQVSTTQVSKIEHVSISELNNKKKKEFRFRRFSKGKIHIVRSDVISLKYK